MIVFTLFGCGCLCGFGFPFAVAEAVNASAPTSSAARTNQRRIWFLPFRCDRFRTIFFPLLTKKIPAERASCDAPEPFYVYVPIGSNCQMTTFWRREKWQTGLPLGSIPGGAMLFSAISAE